MRRPRKHRGILFITSVSALAIMSVAGTMFLGITAQQLNDARRNLEDLQTVAVADGGVNYIIWRQKWAAKDSVAPGVIGGQVLPIEAQPPLAADFPLRDISTENASGYVVVPDFANPIEVQARVWLYQYDVSDIHGFQAISMGEYRGRRKKVRAVLQGSREGANEGAGGTGETPIPMPPLFNYAFFSGSSLTMSGNSYIFGDVGCNGAFTGSGGGSKWPFNVTGKINAAAKISLGGGFLVQGRGEYGTSYKTTGGSFALGGWSKAGIVKAFPTVDLQAWKAFCLANGTTYPGSLTVSGDRVFNPGISVVEGDLHISSKVAFSAPVVYVKGNVSFSGQSTINTPCTIIAEGSVSISGQLHTDPPPPTDTVGLALIAANGLKLTGQTYIDAVCFAHGITNESDFSGTGQATVYGAVIADAIGASGQFEIHARKPSTYVTPPPTPGIPGGGDQTGIANYAWNVASWEVLDTAPR